MNGFLLIAIALLLLAVLASLVAGVVIMAKGGQTDKKYSNKLMQVRLYLQGAALIVLIFIALAMSGT